ncbi:MAG: FkbM family methyltransferase [Geminicoccaceae bacterium]
MSHLAQFLETDFGDRCRSMIRRLGLRSIALSLYRTYQSIHGGLRRQFRIDVEGAEVVFVTEDSHSKRFFHHRYRPGQWHEPPVTRQILRHLPGTKTFADVGAHLGYYGCIAGALDRDRRVFLFEMNHNLVPLIQRNLDANRLNNAEVVNHPVSDRRKTVSYDRDSTDAGLSMAEGTATPATPSHQIETVTLDDFFHERGVVPDVIKMDVQGAELEALKGGERLLRDHHPVLFLEVHPKVIGDFGATVGEIYDYLTVDLKYKLKRIEEHRRAAAADLLHDITDAKDLPTTTHMLLCT